MRVSLYLDKKNQITYLNCGKSSRGKSARYPRDTQGIENIPNKSIKTPAEETRFCLNIKYNQQRRIHEDIFTPISSAMEKSSTLPQGLEYCVFFTREEIDDFGIRKKNLPAKTNPFRSRSGLS